MSLHDRYGGIYSGGEWIAVGASPEAAIMALVGKDK
jgi:hypothetical protein